MNSKMKKLDGELEKLLLKQVMNIIILKFYRR